MNTGQYTLEILNQLQRTLDQALDGLTQEEITYRPGRESNSIGFILWHQLRVEDAMINAMLLNKPQLWESENWCEKLGFPAGSTEDGWGYDAGQLNAFKVPPLKEMVEYGAAVRKATLNYVSGLTPDRLAEVQTTPFGDMPVEGMLAMMTGELALHTGQIAYIRGLQRGLNK
jgi:hypothetical protein